MSEQTTTDWKREAAIWRARAEHLQAAVDRLRSLAVAGESVGFLAHELNNLYTPVVGYCHAAQAPGADEIVRTKAIAKSLAAAERVGELTSLVLRLAGTASEGAELGGAADLHECVSGGLAVLGAEQWTREGIEVSLDVPRGTCVGASMGLVQQVVMNLVLNGRRAMNGRRGRVEVSAREVEGGVRMEVRDGGVGMDAAVMGRVLGITQGDDAAWINHPAGSTGHGGSRGAAGEIGVAAPVGDRYEVDVQELARSGSINGQARWGVRMKRAAGERSAREKGVREPASTINQSGAAAGQQRAGEKKIARLRAAKIDASASPIRVWDAQEVAAELRALREGCGGDLAPQSSGQRVEGQEQVGGAERSARACDGKGPGARGDEADGSGGAGAGRGGELAGLRSARGAHERGTGLGLALCLELVGRVGGQMWAESRVGEGTVVVVEWPGAGNGAGVKSAA